MGVLVKLLLVVVGIGLAVKFGVLDQLNEAAREAAMQSGASPAQVEAGASAVSSFSITAIMEAIGTLPPPWGAIGKLLFLLLLMVAALSIVAGIVKLGARTMRWFREIVT